jgi:DNA-binding MarR family transcriptional regulator
LIQQGTASDARLDARELGAWRGLLRVRAALAVELDHELQAEHGLALSEYEVLMLLADAPERRLRLADLASQALVTQSGISRLVDRLERGALVARVRCEEDRRGFFAALTDEGARRLEQARPTHLAGVRRRFLAHFSPEELDALGAAWERVLPGASR